MGRRRRQRESGGGVSRADSSSYRDADGNTLVLRGALSPRTRYARIASGRGLAPGASREDAWQRAVEFLFERLAESWTIAGTPAITDQRELLGRLRMASTDERRWVRTCIREHCEANFPDLAAP
jgi:hypothetical protein